MLDDPRRSKRTISTKNALDPPVLSIIVLYLNLCDVNIVKPQNHHKSSFLNYMLTTHAHALAVTLSSALELELGRPIFWDFFDGQSLPHPQAARSFRTKYSLDSLLGHFANPPKSELDYPHLYPCPLRRGIFSYVQP